MNTSPMVSVLVGVGVVAVVVAGYGVARGLCRTHASTGAAPALSQSGVVPVNGSIHVMSSYAAASSAKISPRRVRNSASFDANGPRLGSSRVLMSISTPPLEVKAAASDASDASSRAGVGG